MSLKSTLETALSNLAENVVPDKNLDALKDKLRIKYRLEQAPDKEKIVKWQRSATTYFYKGHTVDVAGETAAKETFDGYHAVFYGEETDSTEALLAAAKAYDEG